MGKGRFFGSIAAVAMLVLVASWGGGGCGISNDQGISFRALGFFEEGDGSAGDNGDVASLNFDQSVPSDDDDDGELDGGFLGLENNMLQGIRVERVDLSYRVTGGSLAIPNDSFALGSRLGPSSGQEPNNPPLRFEQILIVSPQMFEFLNQNRSRLPDPPFTMVASAVAVGVTDSGDRFDTNPVSFTIIFVEGVAPTPESGGSPTPTP